MEGSYESGTLILGVEEPQGGNFENRDKNQP